jgi:hypothetical protein
MDLRSILRSSYSSKNASELFFNKNGFYFDRSLSNIESRVYFRPDDSKLVIVFRGTKSFHDLPTDLAELFGDIKSTSRYKSSRQVLERSKAKYGVNATIIGHSLGGSLASAVNTDPSDRVISYNKGQGLGINSTKRNELALRHRGDVISLLGSRKSTTIGDYKLPLSAHSLDDSDLDLLF